MLLDRLISMWLYAGSVCSVAEAGFAVVHFLERSLNLWASKAYCVMGW